MYPPNKPHYWNCGPGCSWTTPFYLGLQYYMVSTHLEATCDPTTQWIAANTSGWICRYGLSVQVSFTMPLPSSFWVESGMHRTINWFWCPPTSQSNVKLHEAGHPVTTVLVQGGSAPHFRSICPPTLLSRFTLRLATATCCRLFAPGPTWISGSHPGALSFPRVLQQCT